MSPPLANTVAAVTGASSGIGRATSLELARLGAQLVLIGRDEEQLATCAREIERSGGSAQWRSCNLSASEEVDELAEWLAAFRPSVDLLVNSAGAFSRAKSVRWIDQDAWNDVVTLNLTAPFLLTKACLPAMLETGRGTIITISSVAARTPSALGGVAYGAAKSGVANLMRGVSAELRDQGIRACTIFPGEVDSPMHLHRPKPPDSEARATMMQPEDVARVVALVASLPARTLVEEVVMTPTRRRDVREDMRIALEEGAPLDDRSTG